MTVDAPEHPTPRPDRRRRPGPPASAPWRWAYPVLLVGLAMLTLVLSATGARLVLDSRDGQVGRSEQDPTKPGYLATVPATPLLLVVHADDDRNLYGAIVMSLGADDTGGSAVFLPPDTLVAPGEDGSLSAIYKQFGEYDLTTGNGLRIAVSTLLQADIDSTITVDATSLAPLIEPVAPLHFEVAKAVKVTRNGKTTTVLDAGEASVQTSDEIASAIETIGTGETALDRMARQSAFWRAWIDAVRANQDTAFGGNAETDIARFVRGLAAGVPQMSELPTVVYLGARSVDTLKLTAQLPSIVPYPRQEGERINVAVLNGVGDQTLNEPMERQLIAAGAQIASRGNPGSFGVATTSVVYHDPSGKKDAESLAEAVGATDVRFEAKVDSDIEVTVTIGADFDPSEPVATTTTTSPSSSTGAPR